MKWLLLGIFIFTSSVASARLGESLEQCQARYGNPAKKEDGMCIFRKAGFLILVRFYQNRADSICYTKLEMDDAGLFPKEISDDEINLLLTANGSGAWKRRGVVSMNREWQNEDAALFATYDPFGNRMLLVFTKESEERAAAERKAKENQNLKGF